MLRKKTFQNKVAASRYSLPITATLATLVWVAVGLLVSNIWVEFAFTAMSTLLMVELNNRNALMRTYSRMVSCSFLALLTMTGLSHPSLKSSIVTMCFIAFYLIIWNCYQDKRSTGWTFYAFACIGLASMIFVQIGYFMPILWIMMMVFTLSFSVKTFFASLVGLIVPYWFAAGYFFYTDNIQGLADHFCEFINYSELFDYSQVTDHQILNLSFVTLLTIIGSIHFIRTSYGDKIRTRMIYETFIMISVACIIFIVLQPQHIQELGGILIVNTAPLIAHFITFTRGKFTNISFILLLIMLVLIKLTTYSYQRAYYYELDYRFLNELGLLGHAGISLPCRQFLSLQQRGGHVGLTGCRTGTYPARTVWKHRQCARFYVQLWRRTDGQAGMDREISACKERES